MNLVVIGNDIPAAILDELALVSGAGAIERIDDGAVRLRSVTPSDRVAEICAGARLDFGFVPEDRRLRSMGLFCTDMDSTLITIEFIDEIADLAGRKSEVAAITEASMQGRIDFTESLRRRVAALAGLDAAALQQVYDDRLRLSGGAEDLMRALRQAGVRTMLVSGGFTFFTDRLEARLGFDYAFGNELEIAGGRLTGKLVGAVLDADAKAALLTRTRDDLGLRAEQTIAIGDGANDRAMLAAAGVGIAYRAKPILRQAATHVIDHADLGAVVRFFS